MRVNERPEPGAGAAARQRLHVRVGLAFVRTLRPALYALLVLSAVLAFWAGGELFGRSPPHWAPSIAPSIFGVFLVVFSIYRIALVRARRYPVAPGLFQIGLGALLWVLLLPGVRETLSRPQEMQGDTVPALLASGDPRVRAAAAELAGLREGGQRYAQVLLDRLDDRDAAVRAAARKSLARIAGADVAEGLSDQEAAQRWRAEAEARGWTSADAPGR